MSQSKVPRAWNDLDALEQAIISHLHLHPDSKRKEVLEAVTGNSPIMVWRRLDTLKKEGIIDTDRGERSARRRADEVARVRANFKSKKPGKPVGGSAPHVYRLSSLGETLRQNATDA
jgi:hypothetical protein